MHDYLNVDHKIVSNPIEFTINKYAATELVLCSRYPTSLSVMAASKLHPTAVPSDWVCLQHVKVPDYCSLHNSIQVWGLNNGNRNAVSWV